VAIGENSTLEKGFGTSDQAKIHPCAYNNPIFVDVDGNGFEPSGETLRLSAGDGRDLRWIRRRKILEKGGKESLSAPGPG